MRRVLSAHHPAHTHNTELSSDGAAEPVLGLRPGTAAAGCNTLGDSDQERGAWHPPEQTGNFELWEEKETVMLAIMWYRHISRQEHPSEWCLVDGDIGVSIGHQDGDRRSAVCIIRWCEEDLLTIRHQAPVQCRPGQYGPGQRGGWREEESLERCDQIPAFLSERFYSV